MDKYEFNIKVEQIKKLVGKNDYETAMKIADTVDWKRVRNTNLLSMVAMVYEKNEEYQEAKDILLLAFERAPIGKRLLYKLAELALKENNVEESEAYYREFCDLAPDDPRQNLLRYMILRAKGAPVQQLIHSLESYIAEELDEKWMYELALLYHEAGMGDQCTALCDRIMLMFGLGKYVDKAMELKVQYAPLTSYQQDLVENRDKYEARLRAVEQGIRDTMGPPVDEEEDYEDSEPEIPMPRAVEMDPAVTLREAEEEERLAKEMSKISLNEEMEEPSPMERTRVLDNIRNIKPLYETPDVSEYPEPTVEEDLPEASGSDYEEASYQRAAYGENSYGKTAYGEGAYSNAVHEEGAYGGAGFGDAAYGETTYGDTVYDNAAHREAAYRETVYEEPVYGEHQPYMETAATAMAPVYPEEEIVEEEPELDSRMMNHLMIESHTPEEGFKLAVEALKQIHLETGVKNQVLKIGGERLARRGVLASAAKLAGKDLIVENAGDLTDEALNELNELMNRDSTGMIVVLIDNPRQMEELHRAHPSLAGKFECIGSREASGSSRREIDVESVERAVLKQADIQEAIAKETVTAAPERRQPGVQKPVVQRPPVVEVPPVPEEEYEPEYEDSEFADDEEMDIDTFAQYACRYASEIDCSVTGKSMLALYERIEIMEEDGVPLTKENAENLIEEAADRAEKPSFGKLIKGVFSSKYDKDGLLILKEEHFI